MFKSFKPHIVSFANGTFAVRKRFLFWYHYASRDADFWWPAEYKNDYCICKTLEQAKEVLCRISDKGVPVP